MSKLIIALSGVARSGKNTFADILQYQLRTTRGLCCQQFSLANELKLDCEQFIKEKLGLNVWSNVTEEKEIFRPILIEYGKIKRKQTNGQYWTNLLTDKVKYGSHDVAIITDVRYSEYEDDELQWVKKLDGVLVHISKFLTRDGISIVFNQTNPDKIYTLPPNEPEKINDPKMKEGADYIIEWEDQTRYYDGELMQNDYLNSVVSDFIKKLVDSRKLI